MSWDLWQFIFYRLFPILRTTYYIIILPNVSINFGKEVGIWIKNKLTCLRVLFLRWFFFMCFFLLLILHFNLLLFILYLGLLNCIVHFWFTSSVLHVWFLYFLLYHLLWLIWMRSLNARWRLYHALHLTLKIIHLLTHNL